MSEQCVLPMPTWISSPGSATIPKGTRGNGGICGRPGGRKQGREGNLRGQFLLDTFSLVSLVAQEPGALS